MTLNANPKIYIQMICTAWKKSFALSLYNSTNQQNKKDSELSQGQNTASSKSRCFPGMERTLDTCCE